MSPSNYGYWLYTGQEYWAFSPQNFSSSIAYVYKIDVDGSLRGNSVSGWSKGLRPVVNLKPEYFKTQDAEGNPLDGTIDKPYIASAS